MEEKPVPRVIPKILVSAPTSKQHDYIIDRYITNVLGFDYDDFDAVLVDTSDVPWDKLRDRPFTILRCEPSDNALETLSRARNMIIDHMLANDYDYLLMIDTDTLPPKDVITRLLSHKKDIVGLLSHGGTEENHNVRPIVLKSGSLVKAGIRGLDYYSWEEIEQMAGQLTRVWGTSVGCLLVSRKVLEAGVRFKYTPRFHIGEDIWFFLQANGAGFEFWLDPYRVIHENRYWQKVETTLKMVKKLQASKVSKAELSDRMKRIELIVAELIRSLKEKKVIE
jgi:cellulose synthase/poly-beta-1,6-N-acetylglucosamine synthase-like glycosyltransferase